MRGAFQTLQRTRAPPQASCRALLSVKRSRLFRFAANRVGNPQSEAERPRVVFNNRNVFFEFYHVGRELGAAASHPLNEGTVEETAFYDKWFSLLDPDVREPSEFTSVTRDTGTDSSL